MNCPIDGKLIFDGLKPDHLPARSKHFCRKEMVDKIIALLILLFAIPGFTKVSESECGTVDFSDRFVPPRDQGNAGYCFAFTASDLLAEANGIRPPDTVSALNVGANYNSSSNLDRKRAHGGVDINKGEPPLKAQTLIQGGAMGGLVVGTTYGNTAAIVQRPGQFYGGMSKIPGWHAPIFERPTEHADTFPGDEAKKQLLFETNRIVAQAQSFHDQQPWNRDGGFTETAANLMIQKGRICLESEVPSQLPARTDNDIKQVLFIQTQMGRPWKNIPMSPSLPALRNVKKFDFLEEECESNIKNSPAHLEKQITPLHAAVKDWATLKIKNEQEKNCKNNIRPQGKVHVFYPEQGNPEQSVKLIKNLLSPEMSRPFGLSYDSCLLVNCPPKKSSPFTNHASVIVGRYWNKAKNRCDLKIKNSWSASCDNKRSDVDCKDGYWSVGIDTVVNSPHEIQWIDKASH